LVYCSFQQCLSDDPTAFILEASMRLERSDQPSVYQLLPLCQRLEITSNIAAA
jgi:hypothetical protein